MCVLESRDVPGLRGAEGPACRGWLPGEGVGRVGRVGAVDRAQRLARGAGCRSGRALPACHVNKETKRGHEASFFSRPRKSAVVMRRGLRPAPRALPRVGRMPPPGPPGLRPLCAVRHTGTFRLFINKKSLIQVVIEIPCLIMQSVSYASKDSLIGYAFVIAIGCKLMSICCFLIVD